MKKVMNNLRLIVVATIIFGILVFPAFGRGTTQINNFAGVVGFYKTFGEYLFPDVFSDGIPVSGISTGSKSADVMAGLTLLMSLDQKASGKSDTLRIKTSAVCRECKDRIEQNMAFEKGIKDVSLDLDTKIATIRYNPKSTTPDQIRKKISKLGYDADDVPADPVAYEKLPACCKKDAPKH